MSADRHNYQFGRHGSHLMTYHSIYSRLQGKQLCEKIVAILMIPVAKFTRSVTLQFLKDIYCKDCDSRL
jgi:hypothetical protein